MALGENGAKTKIKRYFRSHTHTNHPALGQPSSTAYCLLFSNTHEKDTYRVTRCVLLVYIRDLRLFISLRESARCMDSGGKGRAQTKNVGFGYYLCSEKRIWSCEAAFVLTDAQGNDISTQERVLTSNP